MLNQLKKDLKKIKGPSKYAKFVFYDGVKLLIDYDNAVKEKNESDNRSKGWKTVKDGEAFEVPARSKFGLKIKKTTAYCCSFIG